MYYICTNPAISIIEIGKFNHKIGLYADDVNIFITNPTQSLPYVHHTLDPIFIQNQLFQILYEWSQYGSQHQA